MGYRTGKDLPVAIQNELEPNELDYRWQQHYGLEHDFVCNEFSWFGPAAFLSRSAAVRIVPLRITVDWDG